MDQILGGLQSAAQRWDPSDVGSFADGGLQVAADQGVPRE